jgi:DNA-binding GntR family transcriptional regulator
MNTTTVYQIGCVGPAKMVCLPPVPTRNPPRSRRAPRSSVARGTAATPTNGDRPDSVWRVYQELRQLIVSGQLPPGARIAERVVADRLGLSRTPVRSALHRLQQEGFVDSYGRGRDQRLVVTPLTQEDGREIMLIVGHLEGLAARTAAQLASAPRSQVVRQLRELNRVMGAESRKRVTVSRIFDLDQAFHNAYVDGVIGPRLLALHSAIKPQVERYSRLYISSLVDELPTSVREHEAIIRAIATGDPAAAQRAVETNWRNAAGRLTRVIAEHGERGIWHAWDEGGPLAPAKARGR